MVRMAPGSRRIASTAGLRVANSFLLSSERFKNVDADAATFAGDHIHRIMVGKSHLFDIPERKIAIFRRRGFDEQRFQFSQLH